MKQFPFIFSFFLLGGLLLQSCKSKQTPGETTERIIHKTETVKDTILIVEKDSSYYSAYIDCVNGKPVLVQSQSQISNYNEKSGTKATEPISKPGKYLDIPKVNLKDGLLTVNCEKKAQELFFSWKETFIQEWEITHQPSPPIEKELTTFQEVKMAVGNLVIWLSGLISIAFLIRFLISKKLF